MPNPRVNPWAIRRIVGALPARSTEDQVRARARECCAAGSSDEFIRAAEDAALRYFRRGGRGDARPEPLPRAWELLEGDGHMISVGDEGYRGPARTTRCLVGYTEPPNCVDPGRVIVRDGQFTPEATEADRARLAAKLAPVRYRESRDLRAWAANVTQRRHSSRAAGKPLGRPAKLSHLKPQIEQLRAEGLSWRQIGEQLGVNHEAARMVVMARGKRAA